MPELARHLASAWALWEMADGGAGYDAVEVVDWGLLFVPWVLRADGAPVLVQLHGSTGQISVHDPAAGQEAMSALVRLIEKCGLGRAAALQTYSSANRRFWQEITGREVEFMQPMLPLENPSRVPASERVRNGLVIGRVQRWKGPQFLCDALARYKHRSTAIDWVGRVSADGLTGRPYAETLAARYPGVWGHAVKSVGPRMPVEVAVLQRRARFVVVPSLWDVFNFTCVEAMAAGTPVVCSDGAGAAEWIEQGRNGWRVPAGDAAALAEVLDEIAGLDANDLDKVGEAAQETIGANFSEDAVLPDREALLARVAAGAGSRVRDDEWLREICSPGAPSGRHLAFLDQQPLKPLAAYTFSRVVRRLKGQ
jgi:glycosyltransferase involved in cell wall biosynthesis